MVEISKQYIIINSDVTAFTTTKVSLGHRNCAFTISHIYGHCCTLEFYMHCMVLQLCMLDDNFIILLCMCGVCMHACMRAYMCMCVCVCARVCGS